MRKYLILLSTIILLASCGKNGNNNAKPSVTTLPVTNITTTGATSGCDITSKGGSALTDAGIMWDTTSKFSSAHDSSNYSSALNFTITIPGLLPGTTWFVRAYATNNAGTAYGNALQFTTDTLPSDYTVTTIAGNGTRGFDNGPALSATVFNSAGIAVSPGGIVYYGDGTSLTGSPQSTDHGYIRKIGTDGTVSTVAMVGRSSTGVALDASGNIYDFDINDTLYKITPSGVITILASGFNLPTCIDIDNAGNLYVTFDVNGNELIARISPGGIVKILPVPGYTDPAITAIAIDRKNNLIYVSQGPKVERIDTLGNITFIAGSNGTADGTGSAAGFGTGVLALRVDKDGNLIATDPSLHKIRMITPTGVVTTIAGNGVAGDVDGSASRANFSSPIALAIDTSGNIFVTDYSDVKIKKIAHK